MYRILLGLAVVLVGMLAFAQEKDCEEGELTSVEGTGCKQFRMCDGTNRWSIPMDCAPGTLFDPAKKECCRPGVTPGSGCRNFTICLFNMPVIFTCGNNTVFSDSYRVCVRPLSLSTDDRQLC